ncbi:MAG: hypothetical protein LAP40_02645 [Acidobacteriia bacterium]|nr:hypothetical protein [Terriglobia bacterium]
MFPWNYGFHWSTGNVLFLGAFYTVLVVVATTVASAILRARRAVAAQQTDAIRWRSDFHDLPPRDRVCRHVLTGEFQVRECPNAFDCRQCETHARLVALHPPEAPPESGEELLGMSFPLDRFYHRGHTWARLGPDGAVTIGLDELGRRVLGVPDAVDLPAPGTRLRVNGPAWHIHKRNRDVRVLSPADGEVVEATGGIGGDGYLRVKPVGRGFDFRNLLAPCEVKPWLLREVERLQGALSAEGVPTLADGGVLLPDLSTAYPQADWDAACDAMFLQA